MWHHQLAHLIERDHWGRRYLFIRPFTWFQGFEADPGFRYFAPLATGSARTVVRELVAHDRRFLWRLYELSRRSRLCETPDEYQTASFLIRHILDGTCIRWRLAAGAPDHFCVLREERPPVEAPRSKPVQERAPFRPAPLSATNAWIAVQCVDDSERQRPVPRVRLELATAAGEVRSVLTDESGTVLVTGIAPGRVIIRVLERDGSQWKALHGGASEPSTAEERMTWHAVKPGECISKLAHRYGLRSWQELWEHPKNEALRKKRKSPHVLLPGDEVAVPQPRLHEIARETNATHRIEIASAALAELRVVLQDHNQRPFKNERYELFTSPDRAPKVGSTDGEGRLIEQVPSQLQRVEVHLPRLGLDWTLAVGTLIPLPGDEKEEKTPENRASEQAVMAAQMRLNALGFACGRVDGVLGPRTRYALALLRGASERPNTRDDEVEVLALDKLAERFTV